MSQGSSLVERTHTIKRTAYPLTTGTIQSNVLHTPSLQVQSNQTYCIPPYYRYNPIKRTAYPLTTGKIQSNVLHTPSLQVKHNQTYCIPPHYRYNTIICTAYPLTTGTTQPNHKKKAKTNYYCLGVTSIKIVQTTVMKKIATIG